MVQAEAVEAVLLLDIAALVESLGDAPEGVGDRRYGLIFGVVVSAVSRPVRARVADRLRTGVGDVLELRFATAEIRC